MQRLFFAILLDDACKDVLCDAVAGLRQGSVKGRFTERDNLHLTLVFLGETGRFAGAADAMRRVDAPAFDIGLSGLGRFKRDGGDIWWMGIAQSPPLERLYTQLALALRKAGFDIDARPYRPHLTLGRQVTLQPGFDWAALEKSLPRVAAKAGRISLMESVRQDGRLRYLERDAHPLAGLPKGSL